MRYPLIIGNWKLNGSIKMINKFIANLCKELIGVTNCTVVIAPPVIYLDILKKITIGSNIQLGAQNVDIHLSGAFTGEISALMLKDIGAKYIIIGHSERRFFHNESDELIAKKFLILKEHDLIPILCIGETEEENKKNKTEEVCKRQIDAILETQGVIAFETAVIAYEPIWAIGSGKFPNPIEVQKVHKFIRNYIAKINKKISDQLIIQYGGSVTANNAKDFFSKPDIDGVLIGGSSLDERKFADIINIANFITK